MKRREVIKLAAAAPLAGKDKSLFFTADEFHLVDELSEMIIPADEHSPGARAAQVAAYIDARLAEAFEPAARRLWRSGLKRIDGLSREMCGRPFLRAPGSQRAALLERIAANETQPRKLEEIFFRDLKARTAHAYYTSKLGIHTEMEYKGNTYLREFEGYDAK